MYVADEKKKSNNNYEEGLTSNGNGRKYLLFTLFAVALVLVVGAVGGGAAFALSQDDDNDNNAEDDDEELEGIAAEIEVDFDQTEFNLIEMLGICQEAVTLDSLSLTTTCFAGHGTFCVQDDFNGILLAGFHCPTLFNGLCACDQGSFNHDVEGEIVPCEANLNDAEEDILFDALFEVEDFDDIEFGVCNPGEGEFDANELLSRAVLPDLVDDLQLTLDTFNDVLLRCIDQDFNLIEDGFDDSARFFACLDPTITFACVGTGYVIAVNECEEEIGEPFSRSLAHEQMVKSFNNLLH